MEITITIDIKTQTEKPKFNIKSLSEKLDNWIASDRTNHSKNENLD